MSNSDQKLESLNQHFLDDAKRIIQERFWEQETLTWAANCGFRERFGYVLLSSERIFSVLFDASARGRKRILYIKQDSWWNLSSVSNDRGLYLPPNSELTKREYSSRQVIEVQLSQLKGVSRQDYDVQVKRDATEKMIAVDVVTLGRGGIAEPIFYIYEDGQFLYKFMSDHSRKITDNTSQDPSSDIASLIEALAKLHQAGILSNDEFEAKKKELLPRI
ncbi:MAG TPA: SHOCT domain-containing protein [Chloroflexota bacterium]|nr:SHOCT domain-containing protein [Chloroflexota bacterium]HUM71492.1 SHOCT domain-containing protein [Chloroflexota bacterium]